MSNPADRLLSDAAAERFAMTAQAMLAAAPLIPSATEELATAVLALTVDRQARIELARQAA